MANYERLPTAPPPAYAPSQQTGYPAQAHYPPQQTPYPPQQGYPQPGYPPQPGAYPVVQQPCASYPQQPSYQQYGQQPQQTTVYVVDDHHRCEEERARASKQLRGLLCNSNTLRLLSVLLRCLGASLTRVRSDVVHFFVVGLRWFFFLSERKLICR